MVRDVVANFVYRLLQCGCDPRRIGPDAWESRCPGHQSADYALSITRDAVYGVMLRCRSSHKCMYGRIRRALSLVRGDDETPDWVLQRLSAMEVQTPLFQDPPVDEPHDDGGNASSDAAVEGAGAPNR